MIEEFIKAKLSRILNNDFFIVEIKENPRNDKIQIFLDKFSEGLTLSDCENIHKELYPEIEAIKDNFELEVSSPGLTKPLKVWQQYYKNIGRKIKITTIEGEFFEAKITDANEQQITLLKTKENKELKLTQKQIKKAVLKIF